MSHATPDERHDVTAGGEGKPAALATWILYALAPLTGGLSAVVGVIVALTQKDRASGLARAHLEAQVPLFWSALIWTLLFTAAWWISLALTTVFIGIPLVFLFWGAMLLLGVWFAVRSVLGAVALSGGRTP